MFSETGKTDLPDEAIVLRAGIMDPGDVRDNALSHADKYPDRREWGVSVNCLPGASVEEIARAMGKFNKMMRVSNMGKIREAGLRLIPDGRPDGHSNIMFDHEPTEEEILSLIAAFED